MTHPFIHSFHKPIQPVNYAKLPTLPAGKLLLLALLFLSNCSADMMDDPERFDEPLSTFTGTLHYGFAGDLFVYNLSNGDIDLVAEQKGRQGPFFSPDGAFFTTNNWPGNNEGVAVWRRSSNTIQQEFNLPVTITADDQGVKVAPGGSLFSGILNAAGGNSQDLAVLDDEGQVVYRLDGDAIRMKGHTWDNNQNLYFTGEIAQGTQSGTLILAKVTDLATSAITLIRTFDSEFLDLPNQLAVSPDGQQITYAYKQDIWIGGTTENATDHRLCFSAVQTLSSPVFSPDAKHIAMVMRNSNTSLRGDIHVASIPASGNTVLTVEGSSKLPGPNSSSNSTWADGSDSSLGWFR